MHESLGDRMNVIDASLTGPTGAIGMGRGEKGKEKFVIGHRMSRGTGGA